jgi:hypothetical protein
LSSNTEFRIVLANEGALNVVSKLLTSNDLIALIVSAQTLEYLSIPRKLKLIIFDNGMAIQSVSKFIEPKMKSFYFVLQVFWQIYPLKKIFENKCGNNKIVGALAILRKEQDDNIDYRVFKVHLFYDLYSNCEV